MISFMITTGFLNSQDMIRIGKQWIHDFSGKHLCYGYCMDIMWCLCVEVKISWFCKASLRICYVSWFDCKGPWMLKTVINCHVWNTGLQNYAEKNTMYSVINNIFILLCLIFSQFLILFIYITNIGYWQVLFIT